MRRSTLDLLRCPRCGAGSLVPEADIAESAMSFGPAKCLGCSARFPVHDGLIDFVGERAAVAPLQQAMEHPWMARSWERYVRPAVDTVLTLGRFDAESEYTVLRSLMGSPPGPVLDLGCGSGHTLRRLAHDFQRSVIGLDVSRPMLEEAMAQLREHAVAADFVRAEVPALPFTDACLGGIFAVGVVHLVEDLNRLMDEVARVLKPKGRFVATSYEVGRLAKPLHATAGLFPRSEAELMAAVSQAGLIHFERVKVAPFVMWKAERP